MAVHRISAAGLMDQQVEGNHACAYPRPPYEPCYAFVTVVDINTLIDIEDRTSGSDLFPCPVVPMRGIMFVHQQFLLAWNIISQGYWLQQLYFIAPISFRYFAAPG